MRVKTGLSHDLRKLGASDMNACYSCGNCSAICPLSEGEISFPRRMIRYSMLGLEERILSSPEPWLCYYCGECSETCPREADPGALMMALRRFTIRKYSLGRVADIFYSAFRSGIAWGLLSAIVIIAVVLFHNPEMDRGEVDWLSFISLERFHNAGIGVTAFIGLMFMVNVWIMARAVRSSMPEGSFDARSLARSSFGAVRETVLQERFHECEKDRWRRAAHIAVSWGFMGMFLATVIIMGMDYGYLPLVRAIPFAVGSISGLVTLVGCFFFIYRRITGRTESSKQSRYSDWSFLVLLTGAVLTGFVMVIFKYLGVVMAAYYAFAVHLVFVFNLLVSLPFTKFAHAVYRPLALWLAGVRTSGK